jgi:hypothetical protein
MSDEKLFECRYEVVYYAMGETAADAQREVVGVSSDDPFNWYDVQATEFDPATMGIAEGWDPDAGVYGTGKMEWLSLGDAIQQTIERKKVKDDRQLELPFKETA